MTPRRMVTIAGVALYESIFVLTDSLFHQVLLGCLYCVVLMMTFGVHMLSTGPDPTW